MHVETVKTIVYSIESKYWGIFSIFGSFLLLAALPGEHISEKRIKTTMKPPMVIPLNFGEFWCTHEISQFDTISRTTIENNTISTNT